jgi:WhiB family redox-sensing transcriptional regulator
VEYPTWTGSEPCQSVGGDLWFPDDPFEAKTLNVVAAEVCQPCPSIEPCAEWGIAHEKHGVWGGLSPAQRILIRARRGIHVDTPNHTAWIESIAGLRATGGAA